MKKSIRKQAYMTLSLAFLVGCGGSTGSTTPSNSTNNSTQSGTQTLSSKSVGNKLTANKEGKITQIATSGNANGIAQRDDTIFVSEGQKGVEIIHIGYNDTISTEVLSKIEGVNAQSVTLSADSQKLYIEDDVGFMLIYDISDLTHPIFIGKTTKQKVNTATTSKNGTYTYVPRGKDGLEVQNTSNPSNAEKVSTYKISNAYGVVLVDNDTKALIATGAVGINLLDLSNPTRIDTLANYRVRGSKVMGLSLNESDEILFVATGDKGVLVFNLEILMHKLGY